MKPARIRYITLLGLFLLGAAVAWSTLLEARGPDVSTSRIMTSARLFEKQGRISKAADLYRRVLQAEPGHNGARIRLYILRQNAVEVLRSTQPALAPAGPSVTLAAAVEPVKKAKAVPETRKAVPETKKAVPETRKAVPETKTAVPETKTVVKLKPATKVPAKVKVPQTEARPPKKEVVEPVKKLVPIVAKKIDSPLNREAKPQEVPKQDAAEELKEGGNSDTIEETSPANAVVERKPSETKKILSQVGEKLRTLVSENPTASNESSFETEIPTKPRIPRSLRRNGFVGREATKKRQPTLTNQKGDGGGDEGTATVIEPTPEDGSKTTLPKTQRALSRVGDRFRSLVPKFPIAGQPTTVAEPVTVVDPDNTVLPVAAEPEAELSQGGVDSEPNEIVRKSKAAWMKIRERLSGKTKASRDLEKPRASETPLWKRFKATLKRTRNNVADRIGGKPLPIDVASEAVIETRVEPVAASTGVEPATPAEIARPKQIAPLSVTENIDNASEALKADRNDVPARTMLIDLVATAPDVEAALAAYMLGTRSSGHPDVMAALGEQMTIRKGVARVHMAEAMLRLDGNHVTAADALIGMVGSTDPEVRMMAAFAMQSANAEQKKRCISTLVTALKDSNSDVRASAVLALGSFGPAARMAVPEMVRLIHDEDADTARAAGVALQCVLKRPGTAAVEKTVRPVAAEAVRTE